MAENSKTLFYVGSFGRDLYTIELDARLEKLACAGTHRFAPRPATMTLSDDHRRLYVGHEHSDGTGGASALDIRRPERPELINFIPSDTEGPAHVALMWAQGREWLIGAGYFDGRLQVWPVDAQGRLEPCSCAVQREGSGPFRWESWISRQDHARPHFIAPVEGAQRFLCTDLGTDELCVYRLADGQALREYSRKMRPGSGPRHLAAARGGELYYLIDELDSMVSVLEFDQKDGKIRILQRVSALPDDFTDPSWGSAIRLSPDGRYLYVGNRGHESIAIFRLKDGGRRLECAGWFAGQVEETRDFCLDASGRYMLICNLGTDSVTLNRVDEESGSLRFLSRLTGIEKPACILPVGE